MSRSVSVEGVWMTLRDDHIGTTVTLDETEQIVCQMLAEARHNNNRTCGVRNAKVGSQSDAFTDLEGVAAEFAFCKLFNVYPDFSINPRSSAEGEDDGDAVLKDGRTVDVKSTKYKSGRLLAVPWKEPTVDLFALMVGTFPSYTFKGFMRRDELLTPQRLGNLGRGPTYIAEQDELYE
jgi:hypothetical protein